ncbi:DUF58 domain-containing protein [Thiococcus pfennigii]|uniref:DUF58 domain-containing protein n=1 Tax=Thiococcus pfennigii TaxID=1057 RepID=UPI001908D326|nr:DUF58 domain-containing protein [Thiococcus pfennigii]MBK1699409.1 DUF58 domain-containing protein [Thiococcus pfennigii]
MARPRSDDRRRPAPAGRWGIGRLKARLAAMMRRVPLGRDGAARVAQRYIFILPTGAGLMLALVLFVTLAGSLNYQNNLGLLFTFILAAAAVVSMHQTWLNLLGLEVWATPGPGVFAGDDAQFTLTLRDPGQRARADLRLRGWLGRVHPVALAAGAQERVTLTVTTERRGHQALGTVPIETEFPLGLFRAWCLIESDARVVVYPRPAPVAPLPPPVAAAGSARAQGDRGEGADDFVGPRGYRPGDSPRRLDWKALARERGLIVKQFGGDRAEELWLDWEQVSAADVETRLSRLARQVLEAAEAHVRYGLRLPGRTLPLDSGEPHRQRCLEALATFGQDPL